MGGYARTDTGRRRRVGEIASKKKEKRKRGFWWLLEEIE
jgi:hypothetical protein